VLAALGAAHAAGIGHRDVKPGNILIATDGQAKIADFGIAKSVDGATDTDAMDTTATGQLLGTPAYLAPERLTGGQATAGSDLYSLGVVLYEALSGVKPFSGATPVQTAHAVSQGTHTPLSERRPDADPVFVATIERAMSMDADARFASADAMRDALTPRGDATLVLDAPPLPAGEPGRRPAGGWSPTRRAAAIAVWLCVLVLLGLTAMGALSSSNGSNNTPASATPTTTSATSPPTTAAPVVNITLPPIVKGHKPKGDGGGGSGGGD
jgi:serine/threonine protein kinase